MAGERDVLRLDPGALVGVLAAGRVVPAVLIREEVVRIGDSFRVFMPYYDAVAVEDAVAERVALRVDEVLAAPVAPERRPVLVLERNERILDPERISETVDARSLCVVAAVDGLTGRDRSRRSQDDVRRLRVVLKVRGGALSLHRDGVVDEVFCKPQGHNGVRHRSRVGPDTFQLLLRIRDVVGTGDAGATRRAGRNVAAVLRLNSSPRAAPDVGHERVDVVLQGLARVERAVVVRCRESIGPLGSPVDEIDGRLRLYPDRTITEVATVVDDVVRK